MNTGFRIILVFLVAVAAFLLLMYVTAGRGANEAAPVVLKPVAVRVEALRTMPFVLSEEFYGRLEAQTRVEMAFQIEGRLVQLGPTAERRLQADEFVHKGQVIARLEPERFENLVAQNAGSAAMARARLDGAQTRVDSARYRMENARITVESQRTMFERGATQKTVLDAAELAFKTAESEWGDAQAQYRVASAEYEVANSRHREAEINLEDATLRAPMDAYVAAVPAEVGQILRSGDTAVVLVDLSRIKLILGVVEAKLPLLNAGQTVSVDVLALQAQARFARERAELAKAREGVVTVVPPAADPRDNLFKVEIELENPERVLRPGMIARAKVTLGQHERIAIPADVAVQAGAKATAFFVDFGQPIGLDLHGLGRAQIDVPVQVARRVEFQPLMVDREYLYLLDPPAGLNLLIVEGHTRLEDGQVVEVVGEAGTNGERMTNVE